MSRQTDNVDRLQRLLAGIKVNTLVTIFYDKKEAVQAANFFRGCGCSCKIESSSYCLMPMHTLTITKPKI